MEGSPHSSRPTPKCPKPRTPSKQPSKRAKRPKASHPPARPETSEPVKYELVGMLARGERYPEDVKTITVTLSIPAPDDECPIALEPIGTATLACMPACHFLDGRPEYSKMTLPCGHSFSAMVLVYSWCKCKMLCPCCRRGLECRANPNHLPAHFREQLRAQVASTTQTEQHDDEREAIEAILHMTPITTSFQALSNARHLEMIVDFSFRPAHERNTPGTGQLTMITPLTTAQQRRSQAPQPTTVFLPSDRHMEVIRCTPREIRSVRITTQMRIVGVGLIDIDTSGEIDFPASDPLTRTPLVVRRSAGSNLLRRVNQPDTLTIVPNTLPFAPISTFELTFGQRNGGCFLDGVTWVPDNSHVHVSINPVQ